MTSQAYADATLDERKKYFDELAKVAKQFDIKLVFWGTPYGVPESLTIVVESEKSLDNFIKYNEAVGRRLAELGLKPYGVSATTITVTAQE